MNNDKLVSIEDTRFIFTTNFAGDPDRDTFGSDRRQCNIVIPDPQLADDLAREGFNVKETRPRPGEEEGFVPDYFVKVSMNYDSKWPPRIYLVSGDNEPRLLDEDSVGALDDMRVENVNVVLNKYYNERVRKYSLYVKTMYVEQRLEDDPFAARYARRGRRFEPAEYECPEDDRPFR